MLKRIIIWILWLVCAAILHLFGNNAGTLIILTASALTPVLSVIMAKLSSARIDAFINLPERSDKGVEISVSLTIINSGIISMPLAECIIICENLLTGEKSEQSLRFSVARRSEKNLYFDILSDHCGKLRVFAKNSRVFDLFGIFAWRTGFHTKIKKETLIVPETFEPRITLIDDVKALVDSDEYSMTKPGSDPGETFAIREYIPGDPIKSIHWKLSEKADKLMMREFGLPVVKRVLVLLETTILPEYGELRAETIDAAVEIFTSVSLAFTYMGIIHTIGWRNTESGTFESREIRVSGDIEAVIEDFLSNLIMTGNITAAACFSNFQGQCAYAHVITISPYIQPDIGLLYNGNRVTVLHCSDKANSSADRVHAISFAESSYQRDLYEMEL